MKSVTLTTLLALTLMAYSHEANAHKTQRNLCSDLADFFSLIPRSKFNSITDSHYKTDAQFVRAMRYVRTAKFRDIIQDLEDSTSFRKILNYLDSAGVDTKSLGSLYSNVLRVLKPVLNYPHSSPYISGRSLQTYSTEIANTVSHQAFYNMVQQKMRESRQFTKFYTAVRKNSFRVTVLNALNGKDIAGSLRTLRLNGIDVRQQILLLLKVISWGPRV